MTSRSRDRFLASVSLVDGTCSTSDSFSSCDRHDDLEDRKVKVRSLVTDLQEGEERTYACDINGLRPRGLTDQKVVTITVRGTRKYFFTQLSYGTHV
jgi:hypothetical protein